MTGLQGNLPWGGMTLRADFDVHWRAYKNNQTIFSDREGNLNQRYDIQKTILAQYVTPLHFWELSFTAQYQGIFNSSRIPVYDYDKNVWTGIVTWTY